MKATTPVDRPYREAGFSLIEVTTVLLIIVVVSGFALVNINAILPGMKANAAAELAMAQLRSGRQLAISQRRNIEIRFVGTNQIQLVRYDVPSGTTVISTVTLGNLNQFLLFVGVPDTPDYFGNGTAVYFGGTAPWIFLPNGVLIDGTTNPVNGSVFLGQAGHPETARAVTILGATGRVRNYKWIRTSWVH